MSIFDTRICALGEGPLWHPLRQQLFWFDILGKQLMSLSDAGPEAWHFDEMVSAAGWIDHDSLLIASETALSRFHLVSHACETVAALEPDNPVTRSNDGRADPWGGFWIGTMGKGAGGKGTERGAGSIHRLYKGELRVLFRGLTTPNAICFAPDGGFAYFADTPTQIVSRVALDSQGWPATAPEPFIDLRDQGLKPDGAVTDALGNLWIALWGAARVAVFAPDGKRLGHHPFPAPHVTCPAFAGRTLYVTSATQGMDAEALGAYPGAGQVFALEAAGEGRDEPRVLL